MFTTEYRIVFIFFSCLAYISIIPYPSDKFGHKLQFSKEVKEIVEEYSFHPTQELTQNSNSTTTVTFTAGGAYEICWFLFRWGKHVKILAPKKLKDTYKTLLEDAKKQIQE